MSSRFVAILFLSVSTTLTNIALATRCAGFEPISAFESAQVVFLGEVASSQWTPNGDGETTFRVITNWKGAAQSRMRVIQQARGTRRAQLASDRRYIVFALRSSACLTGDCCVIGDCSPVLDPDEHPKLKSLLDDLSSTTYQSLSVNWKPDESFDPCAHLSTVVSPRRRDAEAFREAYDLIMGANIDHEKAYEKAYEKALELLQKDLGFSDSPNIPDIDYNYGWALHCAVMLEQFELALNYYRTLAERFRGQICGGHVCWAGQMMNARERLSQSKEPASIAVLNEIYKLDIATLKKFRISVLDLVNSASQRNPCAQKTLQEGSYPKEVSELISLGLLKPNFVPSNRDE